MSAEAKQTVAPLNPAFAQRFGPVGEALAQELTAFSLDVVGIVAAYAVWGVATAGAQPQELFSFGRELNDEWWGIASSPDGSRIWASSLSTLFVFDADGKHLMTMKNHAFAEPDGIAFASDGRAFVSSSTNHCVSVCESASDCSVVSTIGSHGFEDGELHEPGRIALHGDLLFVVDDGNSRVVVFNKDSGEFVRSFGGEFDEGHGRLDSPRDVAVSASGEVFVCDQDGVKVFSLDGTFLRELGRKGCGPGQFNYPYNLAIDRAGNLFVLDDRMQVLTPQGSFVTEFGKDLSKGMLCVHVDRDGRILVGDRKGIIHVFGFAA